ncbi:class I SAM-dependent methyltransferase [Methanorbis rubei]|uniref:2-methoxy-6-polyprenyl-1,4-benzoquinol methylase, mitochondrial n=1 Tax=Methanorbis rubei TaxID=3028300 RepID=A0AAE4MHU4_9EURY|nr:2-methoxy-6-polyprenyl-1,4-benzoquinol methylase, mitochondrial [Methanocorpusculaceae archaeon Cs1]
MNNTTDESLLAWEANADYWDEKMGDNSNAFHRELVRPYTEKLLEIKSGDFVLDIACGTGNFTQRIVELGARAVAFDYSPKMIAHAKRRRSHILHNAEFVVCDATDSAQLSQLKRKNCFTKAVSNMAVMDIADINPLFFGVYELLCRNGIFVFTTHHPCFTYPHGQYLSSCIHKDTAIAGQPVLQNYYHRSLQEILGSAFAAGFVMDALHETADDDPEIPRIITIRLRKC